MKKTKFITNIVFTIIIAFFALITFVGDVVGSDYSADLTFYEQSQDIVTITNLDIDVVVQKNNIASVTESFDVTFNQAGLSEVVRYVPYASYVYHETENGVGKNIHYSKIYDIAGTGEYNEKCKIYQDEENGYLTIGLKSSGGFYPINQTRSFTISYKMDMGKDTNSGFDDIYFNIVGTNSLLTIENITFHVALPDDVEIVRSLKVYYGKAGSTKTLEVDAIGNIVTGSIDRLGTCEGITIRAVYEDGYLVYDAEIFASQIVSVIAAIVATILALLIIFKFTQRGNYAKPVEVAAPESATPLSADVYLNGECSEKAISAGIVYLASKGYLKIKQHDNKKIELIKIKDADANLSTGMKTLQNAVFSGHKDSVLLEDLTMGFAVSANAIRLAEKTKTNAILYDEKKKKTRNILCLLLLFAAAVALISLFVISVEFFGFYSQIFGFVVIGMILVFAFMAYILETKCHYVFKYICTVLMILLTVALYVHYGYSQIDGLWLGLVACLLIASLPILAHGEAFYSNEGKIAKGRLEGFKDFILKCEVAQLKMFAEENPSYYFDVLPYAYVFGLSNVWMEKFKSIEITIPDWVEVEGTDIVDIMIFNSMFNNFMFISHNNFIKSTIAMAKTSSSSFGGGSFGGGFGGGGFSGGGVGGGGFGAR